MMKPIKPTGGYDETNILMRHSTSKNKHHIDLHHLDSGATVVMWYFSFPTNLCTYIVRFYVVPNVPISFQMVPL